MSDHIEAEEAISQFISELARNLAGFQGGIAQFVDAYSDRLFEARFVDRALSFTTKISRSTPAFWGLTRDKASTLGGKYSEHLVLLTSATSGYFLSPAALTRLLPQFSADKDDGAVKINENKVRAERRFTDLDELAELLHERALARTA